MTDTYSEQPNGGVSLLDLAINARLAQESDRGNRFEADKEPAVKGPIEFVDAWEEEFARALDDNQIIWQYKPRTFAVEWDEEGNFLDSFTPDFYLPDLDVYVALIVPGYRLTGDKARKARLLRQLHSSIDVEVIYTPDCRYLLPKTA